MESSNSIFGRSTNTSQAKPLNTTFVLLMGTTILIAIVVIYGVVKYFDYINFKKTVCDQHKTLNDNIDIINKNNELLSNKKTQLSGHLSKTHENANCVGEWSNCDLDNCTKTYRVKMPKSGEGKDCDYSDGQKLQCSDGDSGDCRPKDCVGNWSECSDDIRTYTITSEGNSLGKQCPAANGAIDRTTCKTDTLTASEIESGIKSEVESGIKSEVESGIKSEIESGIKSEVESGIKSEVESGIKSEVEKISKDDIYFEKKYLFSEIEKVRKKMKNIISSITLDDLKNSMCRLHELKRNNKIFPDIRDIEGYKGYTDQIYESLIYNIKNSSGYDVDYSNLDENYNIQNDIFYQTWWNIKKRIDFEHLLFFVEKEYNIILELGDYIDFIKEIKLEETNYTDEEQMRIQHLQLINNYWKDQFYNWLEVKAKEIYGSEPEYVEYIKKLQYDLSDGTLFKNKLALHIYQVDVDLLEINLHKNNTDNIHILSEIYHHMYVILFYIFKIFSNEWYHFNKNIEHINKRKSDDKRKINTFVSNLDDSCSKISSDTTVQPDTTNFTFQNFIESILDIFFSKN